MELFYTYVPIETIKAMGSNYHENRTRFNNMNFIKYLVREKNSYKFSINRNLLLNILLNIKPSMTLTINQFEAGNLTSTYILQQHNGTHIVSAC